MNNEPFDWYNCDPLFDAVAHYVVERQAVSASAISGNFASVQTEQSKQSGC